MKVGVSHSIYSRRDEEIRREEVGREQPDTIREKGGEEDKDDAEEEEECVVRRLRLVSEAFRAPFC